MNQQIKNNFKCRELDLDQLRKYVSILEKAEELAHLIDKRCPNSREKSLALTNLEQAMMWANAAIQRN